MAKKRKGLGSLGVDALLTQRAPLEGKEPQHDAGETLLEVGVERIRPGRYQPRLRMDEDKLDELAASIKSQGLIQPLLVRALGDGAGDGEGGGEYELIAGERRWRAAQRAGFERVPVVVRATDESSAAALSLIENIQREDLTALEEANALQQLAVRFDLTHQQIADTVGCSRAAVTNLIRLLGLTPEARELLERGDLEMGQGRVLLRLPRDQQGPAGQEMVARQMTVREAERYVEALLNSGDSKGKGKGSKRSSPEIQALERELGEHLGTPVQIKHGKRGGSVVIRYGNLDVLDGVLEKIRK